MLGGGLSLTGLAARARNGLAALRYQVAANRTAAAEASKTQADKTAAQAAVDDLVAAEGNTPRAQALQARVNAIVVATLERTIYIAFGTGVAPATRWNAAAPAGPGVAIANLIDSAGADTGMALDVVTWAGVNNLINMAVPATQVSWIPQAALGTVSSSTSAPGAMRITGVPAGKKFALDFLGCRTGGAAGRNTIFAVNGSSLLPQQDAYANVSTLSSVAGVDPAGGALNFTLARGNPNNGNVYVSVLRLRQMSA